MLGAFKTPTLRGITESAPYDHGGREPTLAAVAQLLQKGGLAPNDPRSAGTSEAWLVPYDDATEMQLFDFLSTLTANAAAP
jgi:cytochrome c peroxidase